MDRAVLADDIVVPDFDSRLSFRRKRNILRRRTDNRAVSDEISAADRDLALDHHVRLYGRFLADYHSWPNDREGANLHIGAEPCIWIDDGCRMNLLIRHVSDSVLTRR